VWEGRTYLVRAVAGQPPAFDPVTIAYLKLDDTPPIPVPPGPGPQPDPTPPPKPSPSGVRQVVIVRESADATPETSRLIVAMRSGPSADYMKSKGHTTLILDDDSKDAAGNVPAVIAANNAAITEIGLPCVLILDSTGRLVAKAKLPETADGVVELVKANGG
jgi:hypothetical protein